MSKIIDQKPFIKSVQKTEQMLTAQGYTFDEAHSFDEAGVEFGGIYGGDGPKPVIRSIKNL